MDQESDKTSTVAEPAAAGPTRWMLIRDAAVFQVKLVVDGFRDLLLIPASFIAAVVSLINSHDGKAGPQFYRLLGMGKRSEHWIDLFAAYRHAPKVIVDEAKTSNASIDDIVHRVEAFVVDEYQRGGVTKQAKDRIDAALESLQKRKQREDPKQ